MGEENLDKNVKIKKRIDTKSVETVLFDPVIRGREVLKDNSVIEIDNGVNMYLVGLVCNFSNSIYLKKSAKYVLNFSVNLIVEKAYDEKDAREKYKYLILNAEHILFMLGVMYNVDLGFHSFKTVDNVFSDERKRRNLCDGGTVLYSMAASNHRNLRGRNNVSDIFDKISCDGLERYVKIVRAGFDYASKIDNENVGLIGLPKHENNFALLKSIDELTSKISEDEIKKLKDDMLMIYNSYLGKPSIDSYTKMIELENLIQKSDNNYYFNPIHKEK